MRTPVANRLETIRRYITLHWRWPYTADVKWLLKLCKRHYTRRWEKKP